jgi:nucleoporin NUP159
MDHPSVFNVITRQSPSDFVFQKIMDPAEPFGLERYPPHHFLLRLKDFPPNLQDLLVVASSASTDIGLFSRSKTPLVADKPADRVTGVFTMTVLHDSRRAQMPMTDDARDTSPIGVGLDLSSREKVDRPIPSDEMDESPTPVPALMVLNNEGVIASWWVIYSESIKQGTSYPGLAAGSGVQQSTQPAQQQTSPFGTSAPTAASNPANTATAFSGFKQASTFGSPSSLGTNTSSAFGAPSGLNQSQSLWGRPASSNTTGTGGTFGALSFGSTTAPNVQGVTFGSSALPGNRASPWSTMTTKTPSATFGQPAGLGMTGGSAFGSTSSVGLFGSGSTGGTIPSSGGFASFANKGGFAAAAAQGSSGNILGSSPATSAFGAPVNNSGNESGSIFGGGNPIMAEKSNGLLGNNSFTLSSTFKPDGSAKDDGPRPNNDGNSFFGNGFGTALTDAQNVSTPVIEEADMDADEPEAEPESQRKPDTNTVLDPKQTVSTSQGFMSSTTPTSTPAAPKFQLPTTTSPIKGSFFGTPPSSGALVTTSAEPKETGFSFGSLSGVPNKPQAPTSPETSSSIQAPTSPDIPKIKEEPHSDEEPDRNINTFPETPLPPEPTSKASYFVGESSVSSTEPDAPLPPDFIPAVVSKKPEESTLPAPEEKTQERPPELIPPTYVPDGPEEGEDSDFGTEDEDDQSESGSEEGSGEDVTKDISPTSELHQTPGFTPQSSFGGSTTRANADNFFTEIPPQPKDAASRSLFGEINKSNTPILYPQNLFPSPRSPSPVRNPLPGRLLRPDASRSVSAPGVASQLLGAQKITSNRVSTTTSSALASSLEHRKAEDARKVEAKIRKEAEETQALIDKEDESIQNFLKKEIVGTRTLDDFIAHQDYVGNADKDSIPAQVEAVYRDINSMIDTLGMNSCSLKSFIKGHTEQYKKSRRTRQDLEDGEDWCLVEIDSLSNIVTRDLTSKLEQGRIKDIASKLKACTGLERDLAKLRAKHEDLKTLLASYSDPENVALVRSQPLTAEQAVQQHDLRRDFTKFQGLLTEAEEALTLLRAKLAYQGNANGNATPGPTVEAVMRTIMKMTNMAEKRSGDIDVLENQMRKLRLSSTTSNCSREASPFATPASKSSVRAPGTSSTYSAFYTPNSVKDTTHGFHASLTSSTHSYSRGTPLRRKVSGFSEEDKQRLKANVTRKKAVTDRLKKALVKNGVRVQPMDSE